MTVPGRVEAARLLCSLVPPEWFVRHVSAVAEVAGWLALRASERGIAVDRRQVESAALLHDVDKLLPADDPLRALPHGEGSAAWLTANGHAELGGLVRDHPVTRLADDAAAARILGASLEARLVAYGDKRAGQRLEPMAARFASWRRRYPVGSADAWTAATLERIDDRAAELERGVCEALRVESTDVRRLRWVARAIASTRG
jgi:HD domain-containing protein